MEHGSQSRSLQNRTLHNGVLSRRGWLFPEIDCVRTVTSSRPCRNRSQWYIDCAMELQERIENVVSLPPAAAVKIRELMATESDVSVLRVAIEGGGCSGFQYGL